MKLPSLNLSSASSSGGVEGGISVGGNSNAGLPWWAIVAIIGAAVLGVVLYLKKSK